MTTDSERLLGQAKTKQERRQEYAFHMLAALLSNPSTDPLLRRSLDEYVEQAILATDQMIKELDK